MYNSNLCKNILVVEDDFEIRDSLKEALSMEGYEVMTANNGQEAIDILEKLDQTCLVLLDLMMSVMNGWEFLEARNANPRLASDPVVVVSAVADEKAKDAGASCFLKKPVDLEALLDTVAQFAQPAISHT